MIKNVFVAMVFGIGAAAGAAFADAKEEVQAAVKRLADIGSYSWTTAAEGGPGGMRAGGGSEGKTQKDGLTMLKLQMRDATIDAYLQGEKAVFQSPDGEGWQSTGEANDPNAGPGAGRMVANMARNYRPPAAQALNLASRAENLTKAEDGSYSGTLSEEEAKALMQRRPRGGGPGGPQGGGPGGPGGPDAGPEIRDAKATVKFWASDGVLSKFQFHVTGVMTFNGEEREIDRTTTVEIRDVGKTTIEVPEEAKAKLQ